MWRDERRRSPALQKVTRGVGSSLAVLCDSLSVSMTNLRTVTVLTLYLLSSCPCARLFHVCFKALVSRVSSPCLQVSSMAEAAAPERGPNRRHRQN